MSQYVNVGGMSESHYGIETLKKIKDEGLGNYTVLFVGPWDNDKIRELAEYCKANDCKFVMDEMINRLSGKLIEKYQNIDKAELQKIVRDCGPSFDGSLIMCEYGGLMLYWPEDYVKGSKMPLSRTDDFAEAEAEMISRLQGVISYAKHIGIPEPYVCIEASGGVAKHLFKAGIDRVDLEVTYNPNNEFFYSAVKGAAEAFGRKRFGVDMAMVWYGGNQHDGLWFKRWKNSLFHAFIRGADPIYAEHGVMDYKALGINLDTEHPKVKKFRDALGALGSFAEKHPRPKGFPNARIGVIHGNLDSYAGLGQTHIWGQRHNDDMKNGSAEDSWDLFNAFYQRQPWEFRYKCGDHDYSGNPPLGQVDIVPAEASLEMMQNYDCLIFLGRNCMTQELYGKLTDYVKNGGHLLATLAHLNAACKLEDNWIINNGDHRKLFGVNVNTDSPGELSMGIKFKQNPSCGNYTFPLWSPNCDPKYCDGSFSMAKIDLDSAEILAVGSEKFVDGDWNEEEIVLTGNQCGKGMAFLVNSLEYPGYKGLKNFYRDLLRFFAAAHQKDLFVECSDRIRYAVYREENVNALYLLNTEENISQEALVSTGDEISLSVNIGAGEIKLLYCSDSFIAEPVNIMDRFGPLKTQDNKIIDYKTLIK